MLNRRKFVFGTTAILSAVSLFKLTGCSKEESTPASTASSGNSKPETEKVVTNEVKAAPEEMGKEEMVKEEAPVEEEMPEKESTTSASSDVARVSEDDPTAVSLNYVHDASKASGRTISDAVCKSCQFFSGDSDWGPCSIFTGKEVSANGWCSAWSKKA
jgi:hypothetical protein